MKVAVLDDYQRRARELADWDALGSETELSFFHTQIPADELPQRLADFDVLVIMRERTRFHRELLERLPKLGLLVTTGMRNAAVDFSYLHERGIVACGTDASGVPEAGGLPSTAEVAWALIFALAKRVRHEDAALRAGNWQLGMPRLLAGATLGLAGLGRLGSAMVAPARIFGMQPIAWSENLTEERAAQVGVERVSKQELLRRSDVLSIHLLLSRRTRGLFGAAELAQMQPHAVLINTSRGPIVQEDALIAALAAERIGGAGLDVFDREPLPADHPLLALQNTVLLPHLGYVSEPTIRRMYAEAIEDILAYAAGAPLRVIDAD
jgi:phosphoglycerate dehydrogenase-like enzyme